jgi:hypothetical protein
MFNQIKKSFMAYQNISVSLPQADIDAVKAAITTINAKLPFLVTLDGEEKQALVKLGAKSADFVNDASMAVASFPNVMPASFDKVEYSKDTSLFKALGEIKLLVDSLSEKIDNTYVAVGSEAMQASLEVYAYVQTAKDRTPGLGSVADKLRERFKKSSRKQKAPAQV